MQKTVFKNIKYLKRYNFLNRVYFMDGLYMTSKYFLYHISPSASHHNNRTRSRYQIYTPECDFQDLSCTKNGFQKRRFLKRYDFANLVEVSRVLYSGVNINVNPRLPSEYNLRKHKSTVVILLSSKKSFTATSEHVLLRNRSFTAT